MGLAVVPLTIWIDGEEYLDGVTITHEGFYERLKHCAGLPTTSQITPHAFAQTFQRELAEGDEAVVITLSNKMSGTCQSAAIAAEEYGGRVWVVDSRNVSAGERILVEYALQLRDRGMRAEAIARALESARGRIRVLALVDTLEYLIKGGRLGKAAGLAGAVLQIHPLLGVKDGEVTAFGKAYGTKKSRELLTQTLYAQGGVDFDMPYLFAYTGLDDDKLRGYLDASRSVWAGHADRSRTVIIGSTVGTHVGPGAAVVAFFAPQATE